jgi:glucose-6-phosphate isomerase
MKELLTVDVGHLVKDGSDHFLSRETFRSLEQSHGAEFEELREKFRAKEIPISCAFSDPSLPTLRPLASSLGKKYKNFLLLGIGGSSLGFRAIEQMLKGPFSHLHAPLRREPRILVIDNIDPILAGQAEKVLDLRDTGLIYISKSGATPESAANFLHFYDAYTRAGGAPGEIVMICGPGENGINRIARRLGCQILHIPPDLPGRYSVLSAVGLYPAELIGVDSAALLRGASAAHQALLDTPLEENPVFVLGSSLAELAARGKSIHVLFNYSSALGQFGLWFVQLWSESLGKRLSTSGAVVERGTTPLAALGATDQHSLLQLFKEGPNDKTYGFVVFDTFPDDVRLSSAFPSEKEYAYFAGRTMAEQLGIEEIATEMSLYRAGRPSYRLTLRDVTAETLGALFYFMESVVIYVAALWEVNPFDQPGVEEGKKMAYSLMGRKDYASLRAEYEKALSAYHAESIPLSIRDLP